MANILHNRTIVPPQLHASARRVLQTLGSNIATARKRRRESQNDFGERIGVSRQTVALMEAGDPQVGAGTYVSALWVLGMHEQLAEVASPASDIQGQASELESLPQRVRRQRSRGDYNF